MAKEEQLAQVEADLARGHTYRALQRLASMAAKYPDDPDVRAKRASVNRQVGNTVEAGRWGYLSEDVTTEEVAAFERAFRDPGARLAALRWRGDGSGLGPRAAQRLRELRAQVTEPEQVRRPNGTVRLAGCAALLLVVLGVLVLAAIGLLSLLR